MTTLNPVQQNIPNRPVQQAARFKGFMSPAAIGAIDSKLSWIQADRVREMFLEDLGGFGLLRTGMDLFRQYFIKPEDRVQEKQLNWSAARERLFREVMSILTDNVSGGLVAFGLASLLSRFRKPNFANHFTSNETMEFFKAVAKQSPDEAAFINNLSNTVSRKHSPAIAQIMTRLANQAPKAKNALSNGDAAVQIAKLLNPNRQTLDKVVSFKQLKHTVQLDDLLDDTTRFVQFMRKRSGKAGNWNTRAINSITETLKVNKWRLPIGLGFAMAATLAVPYINTFITRKLDGTTMYPGEMGLREKQEAETKPKNAAEKFFPYLTQSLKEGKIGPLLGALIPLPFAFGIFDAVKLSLGDWRNALNNPFSKNFLKRLGSMMQFGKGLPFTTPQQMASCFAFLIFSRLTAARSEIEYRERMVDSFLGWGLWILMTPLAKRFIAGLVDKNMMKPSGNGGSILKRRIEIEKLLPKPLSTYAGTLGKFILISAGSLALSLFLTGIAEPYLAIKWTEWQVKRKKRQQPPPEAKPTPQPVFRIPMQPLSQPWLNPAVPVNRAFYPMPPAFAAKMQPS